MLEISIMPFNKAKHFDFLKELLVSQKAFHISETVTTKNLPKRGYIALLGSQPIAAGFLRLLEPCYGQIDCMASNALYGAAIRHKGVSLVVSSLLQTAKDLKLQGIMAISRDEGILKRAADLDFIVIPQTVLVKEL